MVVSLVVSQLCRIWLYLHMRYAIFWKKCDGYLITPVSNNKDILVK